ncbi:unnamed protein product, partial [marine sediment metagenome]
LKYGGGQRRVDLDEAVLPKDNDTSLDDLIALDEALKKLAKEDLVKAELVKLRYFAGLTVEQAAEILEISRATAARYWTYARACLFHEIKKGDIGNSG